MKIKILFLLLFPILTFAQKQKIQLVDKETKKALQFVELLYNNESFFSDKNGNIFIDFNDNKLEIKDGNYKCNLIEITPTTKVIELQTQITELDEMVISKKARIIIAPQNKKIRDYFYIGSDMIFLNEVVFNPEFQNKYLRKVSFKTVPSIPANFETSVKKKDFKENRNKQIQAIQLLRLNIFDQNKEVIYKSNPIEYITSEKQSFEIDIFEDILITDKAIFIEIQVIGFLDETGQFSDYYSTIRPEQTKIVPNDYKLNLLSKKRGSEKEFLDPIKLNVIPEGYINFGFEFENLE